MIQKPMIFIATDHRMHTGVCQHVKSIDADSICHVQSDMWGSGGLMIGRKADIPWEALEKWEAESGNLTNWAVIREAYIN